MLKKIVLGVVAVIVLALLGGLLLPSKYDVERTIVIDRKPAAIFPYLSTLKKWPEWSPWTTEKYPKMTTEYSGPDQGVGAKSAWKDPDNGNGTMVITEANPETGIRYDIDFEGWSTCHGRLLMEESTDGTKIRMGMAIDLGLNPAFRYFGLMMEDAMAAEFDQGLTKLKTVVEALPKEPQMAPTPYTAQQIRDATKPGRKYTFSVERPGKEKTTRTIEFTDVTDEKTTMKLSENGKDVSKSTTWEELMKHASYDEAATTITEEEIEIEGGKFACKLYTVKENGTVTKAWFAKDLPGAPVKHELTSGEEKTVTTLVSHSPGK